MILIVAAKSSFRAFSVQNLFDVRYFEHAV
jgi:hypothetical protein